MDNNIDGLFDDFVAFVLYSGDTYVSDVGSRGSRDITIKNTDTDIVTIFTLDYNHQSIVVRNRDHNGRFYHNYTFYMYNRHTMTFDLT